MRTVLHVISILDKEVYKNKLLEIKNTYRSHLRAYHIDAYEKAGMPLPEDFEETFEVGFPGHLQVGVAISGCLMYGIHGMAGDYDVYNSCSQNDLSYHSISWTSSRNFSGLWQWRCWVVSDMCI